MKFKISEFQTKIPYMEAEVKLYSMECFDIAERKKVNSIFDRMWLPLDLTDDKSILVKGMAWRL